MTTPTGPQSLLNALTRHGVYAGKRASHARGYCAVGRFAPAPDLACCAGCPLMVLASEPIFYAATPISYLSYLEAHATDPRTGVARPARIVAEPAAGTQYLSAAQERQLPDAFLEHEMDERLLHGPIRFQLYAQWPAADDPLDDPSMSWRGQERAPLGTLQISALADNSCDHMTFMPTRLPAGIAISDDPMLRRTMNNSLQISPVR